MPLRFAIIPGVLFLAKLGSLAAQPAPSQREDAEARIFIIQELLLNRVQDLDFGTILAGAASQRVDPRTSPRAGQLVLQFDDTQEWTVSYEASETLAPTNGPPGAAGLPFDPEIYGRPTNNPAGASPIAETERYRTQDGFFYFWIGGEVDASEAQPGTFTGFFTLRVESI